VRSSQRTPEPSHKHDGRWAKLSGAVSEKANMRMNEGHHPGYEVKGRGRGIAAIAQI
jgi:hypothetical protein